MSNIMRNNDFNKIDRIIKRNEARERSMYGRATLIIVIVAIIISLGNYGLIVWKLFFK
jgi:hypothetical protein